MREGKNRGRQPLREPEPPTSQGAQVGSLTLETTPKRIFKDVFDPFLSPGEAEMELISPNTTLTCPSIRQTPDLSYGLPYPLTLAGALFINGELLGLSCCVVIPSRSSPASPEVPPPLRPTPTQLLTVHSTGVDRFPFPKMRDNAINLASIIDEEEMTHDLFLTPSFTFRPGYAAWDPRAWQMERPFANKWGFLFQ